jgi:heme/copper-type cytochrome/quinol oxidase subunit 4
MMPFIFALEANNLGRILDFALAILLVALGLVLVIGDESKSSFVIGGFLHTQNVVKCGFPFMTLFQVFLQRSDLGLELVYFLYMVSDNTSTRGSRCLIVRATRHRK